MKTEFKSAVYIKLNKYIPDSFAQTHIRKQGMQFREDFDIIMELENQIV